MTTRTSFREPEDFTRSEGLRALLNRLHEGGPGAWQCDPVAADLMAYAADKYGALARKHGLDPWEAASAAFDVMRTKAARTANDPWGGGDARRAHHLHRRGTRAGPVVFSTSSPASAHLRVPRRRAVVRSGKPADGLPLGVPRHRPRPDLRRRTGKHDGVLLGRLGSRRRHRPVHAAGLAPARRPRRGRAHLPGARPSGQPPTVRVVVRQRCTSHNG